MVQSLTPESNLFNAGDAKTIRAADLDNEQLRAGNEIVVHRHQVASDKVEWWGHSGPNQLVHNTKHQKGDLIADDADATPIEGDVIVAITDSDGNKLADTTVDDVEGLREAAAESRSDRPTMEAMGPFAKPDRFMEVRVEADAASDGLSVDPAASDLKLHFTRN